MPDVPAISTNTFSNYTISDLYVPEFLYRSYYYDTNWSQFLSVNVCALQPGDYDSFYANSDVIFEDGVERIQDDVEAELGEQGSITVEGEPQPFDTIEQNSDGEGQTASLIGDGDTPGTNNLPVNHLSVKIQVQANRWYFFCFPFDVTIADCEYPGQYVWRTYDGAIRAHYGSGGWVDVTGETLYAQQGYIFQSSKKGQLIVHFDNPTFGGDRPKVLVGHIPQGNANAVNASWNFVGNPYSCYYDFDEYDFDAPITVWNGTSYDAYRPGDDDYHLQPYEAFFVQKPEDVEEISFETDRRETYRQSQKKKEHQVKARRAKGIQPERLLVNLTISDNDTTSIDRTRLVLNQKASRSYELKCDAAKFMSLSAAAQLYTLEGSVQMAINERPIEGDICLGYQAQKAGKLKIEAPRMDLPMILVDNKTNTTFDLSLGTYEFQTEAGTFNERFTLKLSEEASGILSITKQTGVAIGTQNGGVSIGGAEGKNITVYNTGGAQVAQHTGNGFIDLSRGVYVVCVDGLRAKVCVK